MLLLSFEYPSVEVGNMNCGVQTVERFANQQTQRQGYERSIVTGTGIKAVESRYINTVNSMVKRIQVSRSAFMLTANSLSYR